MNYVLIRHLRLSGFLHFTYGVTTIIQIHGFAKKIGQFLFLVMILGHDFEEVYQFRL